jgi:Tol biopolymer transport system component
MSSRSTEGSWKVVRRPPGDYRLSNIVRWTPDGQALTYSVHEGNVSNIWTQALAGGPPRQLTSFTTDRIWDFDWAPDNRLILARGPRTQDLVLISNSESR